MLLPLRLRGIEKSYGDRKVLRGLDFTLDHGGIVGIVGANGAGKTVLMRMISGLEHPDKGAILWGHDGNFQPKKRDRGLILQEPVVLRRSVIQNIEFALQGMDKKEKRERAQEALSMVGLMDESHSYAPALSGGQKKRLGLAQIWAMRPKLILLDEPSVHMDPQATEIFEALTKKLAATQNLQVMIATHDIEQLKRLADKVAFLHEGRLQNFTSVDAFFAAVHNQAVQHYLGIM